MLTRITHDSNGNHLSLEQYCIVNNYQDITPQDCFCSIKGDTSSIKKYFDDHFDQLVFNPVAPAIRGWEAHNFDDTVLQKLINENELLTKINNRFKIFGGFFMKTHPNTQIPWHYDYPRRGPVLNLMLNDAHSHSFFTRHIIDTTDLVQCKYDQGQFCLYNSDMVHSVINLDQIRYTISLWFVEGREELSWEEARDTILQMT